MTDESRPVSVRDRSWTTPDRVGGLIWFVFGAAVVYGSWTMDRLESQNIDPVTAPGVVPGLIGFGIMLFALVLLLRPAGAAAGSHYGGHLIEAHAEEAADHPPNWRRLGLSWALCISFAGLLLGRGLPFWLLAGAFVFLHILLLDDPDRIAEHPFARRVAVAAAIAVCTSAVVMLVFQKVFLVRLP